MRRQRSGAMRLAAGTLITVGSLVFISACVGRGTPAPGTRSGPDMSWHIARSSDCVVVWFRLNADYRENEIAVTDIVVPAALVDAVGLRFPAGWKDASGPAYARLKDGAPIPATHGYRRLKGNLQLSRSAESGLVLCMARPEAATGVLELRYDGHSDVCPLAGTVRAPIGAGPVLARPPEPFPENPILELIPLC